MADFRSAQQKSRAKAKKESSSGDDSDSSSEEEKPKKKASPKASPKAAPRKKQASSSDDDSSSDEKPKKKASPAVEKSSSSSDEDELPPKRARDEEKQPAAAATAAAAKKPRADDGDEGPCSRVFVGALSYECTEDAVREFFAHCGEIVDLYMPMNDWGDKPKGHAFITFNSDEGAAAACEKHEAEFLGRWLRVNYAPKQNLAEWGSTPSAPTEKPDGCTSVFIGNLSWNVDNDALWVHFQDVGVIHEARVAIDRESGQSRGFGHVDFVDTNACTRAVEEKNGSLLDTRDIRVDYAGGSGGSGGKGKSDGSGGKGKSDGKGKGKGKSDGKGKGKGKSDGKGKGKGKSKGKSDGKGKSKGHSKGKGSSWGEGQSFAGVRQQSDAIQEFTGTKQSFGDDSD